LKEKKWTLYKEDRGGCDTGEKGRAPKHALRHFLGGFCTLDINPEPGGPSGAGQRPLEQEAPQEGEHSPGDRVSMERSWNVLSQTKKRGKGEGEDRADAPLKTGSPERNEGISICKHECEQGSNEPKRQGGGPIKELGKQGEPFIRSAVHLATPAENVKAKIRSPWGSRKGRGGSQKRSHDRRGGTASFKRRAKAGWDCKSSISEAIHTGNAKSAKASRWGKGGIKKERDRGNLQSGPLCPGATNPFA